MHVSHSVDMKTILTLSLLEGPRAVYVYCISQYVIVSFGMDVILAAQPKAEKQATVR